MSDHTWCVMGCSHLWCACVFLSPAKSYRNHSGQEKSTGKGCWLGSKGSRDACREWRWGKLSFQRLPWDKLFIAVSHRGPGASIRVRWLWLCPCSWVPEFLIWTFAWSGGGVPVGTGCFLNRKQRRRQGSYFWLTTEWAWGP